MSNKQKDKKRYAKKIPFWLPWLIMVVIVAVSLFLLTWVKKNTKEYSPKDRFIGYSMGSKIVYDENMKLRREDDVTYIDAESSIESDGTPLVYEGKNKYLLPVSMAFLNPNSETGVKRVNYFATTEWDKENNSVIVSSNDKEIVLDSGFLYDGNGTYVFFEKAVVSIGTMKYEIAPMSYVRVYYKDSVEILNLLEEEYQYIEIKENKDVFVTTETDYSINLGTGVMTFQGNPRILFSDINAMGVLE